MLHYVVLLPPPSAPDVVNRRLSVNGSDFNINPNMTEFGGFSGSDGDSVFVRVVDIDDATPTPNESPPREMTFTLTDTIAPPQPGEIGLRIVSES